MNNKHKAFSLIEVIIATTIISITVFGIYKLIGENNKIIHNAGTHQQANMLFPVLNQCIEHIGFSGFFPKTVGTVFDIYFGNNLNECTITSSGIILDSIKYNVSIEILRSTSNYINFETVIDGEQTKTLTGIYKLAQ